MAHTPEFLVIWRYTKFSTSKFKWKEVSIDVSSQTNWNVLLIIIGPFEFVKVEKKRNFWRYVLLKTECAVEILTFQAIFLTTINLKNEKLQFILFFKFSPYRHCFIETIWQSLVLISKAVQTVVFFNQKCINILL